MTLLILRQSCLNFSLWEGWRGRGSGGSDTPALFHKVTLGGCKKNLFQIDYTDEWSNSEIK